MDTLIRTTWIQGHMDTGTQGYRNTEIQGHIDTGTHRYRDT